MSTSPKPWRLLPVCLCKTAAPATWSDSCDVPATKYGLEQFMASADLALDGVKRADALDGFGRDGRSVRLLKIVKLAPRVSPAGRFADAAFGIFIERVEARESVGRQC